ncbi:hypothetical protein K440DRAFT_636160 [Wilcoxina mikolae CBS 423.85]|nr:hypothetical protein K440DRAFT_636160 [Wilcoxina mikolae CBS 423.85]
MSFVQRFWTLKVKDLHSNPSSTLWYDTGHGGLAGCPFVDCDKGLAFLHTFAVVHGADDNSVSSIFHRIIIPNQLGYNHTTIWCGRTTGPMASNRTNGEAIHDGSVQVIPEPSTYIPPQTSSWNSPTVVTVTLAAAALGVAILALLLKYHRQLKAGYDRVAAGEFGGYFQNIGRVGIGFSAGIGNGCKSLTFMVGIGIAAVKRLFGF